MLIGQQMPSNNRYSILRFQKYRAFQQQTTTDDFSLYHTHTPGRRGRDRMVVGFTTTYAIGPYQY